MSTRCLCGGSFEEGTTDVWLDTPAGRLPVLALPRWTCASCGRHAYTIAGLQRAEAVLRAGWEAEGDTADA